MTTADGLYTVHMIRARILASDVVAVAVGTVTVVVIYVALRNRQEARRSRGRRGVSR